MALLRNLSLLVILLLALPLAAAAPDDAIVLKPLRIELPAGEARSIEVDLGNVLVGDFVYKAELPQMDSSRDAVSLGFVEPVGPKMGRRGDTPLEGERVALARRGSPLGIRVVAGRCCTGARSWAIELVPPPGSRTSKGPVWLVRLPVEVVVQPDAKACRRDWMSLVIGVVAGLVILYAYGMVLQSHFLRSKDLARRIEALRWDETGDLQSHLAEDVRGLVGRELSVGRRAWNWLRANPLVFGLPGRAYHETVELHLQRDVQASRLILCPKRALHLDLQKHPEPGEGRLFATALDGTRFFTVPHRGKVGALLLDRPGDLPRQLVWLRSDERLLRNTEERQGFAGWKLHSQGGPR